MTHTATSSTAYRQPHVPFGTRSTSAADQQPTIDHPFIRSIPMNAVPTVSSNSSGWITFVYAQFGIAAFMAAVGIFFLNVDLMVKGYIAMSSFFLVGATFTLAKTVRDEHEAKKLVSRIDDARTEKLLMEVGR